MAASYNFRSAFNGFHREDVVHYIEYINSKHTAQINQLKSDLAAAQQEQSAQEPEAPTLAEHAAELTEKVAQLEEALQAAQQANAQLQAELEAARQQRDEAQTALTDAKRNSDAELEAYRRAERMERQAKERADAMYQRANGILAEATVKVDEAAAQIGGIADQVVAQLAVLQQSVSGSKQALTDAAASLYALRPEE